MNPVAGSLLQIVPDQAVGLSLTEIIGESGLESTLWTRSRIDAEEWLLTWKDRAIRCLVSARPVPAEDIPVGGAPQKAEDLFNRCLARACVLWIPVVMWLASTPSD